MTLQKDGSNVGTFSQDKEYAHVLCVRTVVTPEAPVVQDDGLLVCVAERPAPDHTRSAASSPQ